MPSGIIVYIVGYILFLAVLYFFVSAKETGLGAKMLCSFAAIFYPIIVVPGIGIWIGGFIRRRIE